MTKTTLYFFLFGALLFTAACDNGNKDKDAKKEANEANDVKLDDTKIEGDAEWAVEVADEGMLEVKLAELAATNASSTQVKELAAMMLKDHKKANDELMALAQKKNITLPTQLSDKSQKDLDDMREKKGYDFDKDYADMMVDHHQDAVDDFEKEADKGDDADLKAWAASTLPTLKEHLKHAITCRDIVKSNHKDSKQNAKDKEKY